MHQVLRRLSEPARSPIWGWRWLWRRLLWRLMLCAIIWQANVIAYQRELIRLLSITGSGGAA